MPLVEATILAGRDEVVVQRLIASLTEAVVEATGVEHERVRVIVREVPASHWGVGGAPIDARPS